MVVTIAQWAGMGIGPNSENDQHCIVLIFLKIDIPKNIFLFTECKNIKISTKYDQLKFDVFQKKVPIFYHIKLSIYDMNFFDCIP